jgi:hypothetical protein
VDAVVDAKVDEVDSGAVRAVVKAAAAMGVNETLETRPSRAAAVARVAAAAVDDKTFDSKTVANRDAAVDQR